MEHEAQTPDAIARLVDRQLDAAMNESIKSALPLGHGRRGDCWGVVDVDGERFGRDDSWFVSLDDALIGSGQYRGPVPEDYEIR